MKKQRIGQQRLFCILLILIGSMVLAALPYRAQFRVQAHQAAAVAVDNVLIVGHSLQMGEQSLDIQDRPALFIDSYCRDLLPDILLIPEARRPYVIVTADTQPDFMPEGLNYYWSPNTGTKSPALVWYDQKLVGYMYSVVEPLLYQLSYPRLIGEGQTDNRLDADGTNLNAARAAQQISGTELAPGEVFSFYDYVAPSPQNGYVEGLTLFNTEEGPQWQPDIGGGICRTATALNFAVEEAGMEVIERHNHTETVSYARLGEDTAVARSSGWDYRFRNTTDKTVRIVGIQQEDRLIFEIYELLDQSQEFRTL